MNTLREAVQSYLALRRGLGFKLLLAGNALQDFDNHIADLPPFESNGRRRVRVRTPT
ncbi:hypothetical protein B0G80_1483 [Paraburkholderia sp. BL6669N2]|nr:hypothetical protein B0G80_1483 [Paraburkholderia sp. BL6669N2]